MAQHIMKSGVSDNRQELDGQDCRCTHSKRATRQWRLSICFSAPALFVSIPMCSGVDLEPA